MHTIKRAATGADLNAVESTAAKFITILHQRCLVTHYVTGRRSILTAEIMDPRISQSRFSSNRKIGEVSIPFHVFESYEFGTNDDTFLYGAIRSVN